MSVIVSKQDANQVLRLAFDDAAQALRADVYHVTYNDGFNNSTGSVNFSGLAIYKNGTRIVRANTPWLSNSYDMISSLSVPVKLNAGETIEVYIKHTHTSALTTLGTDVGYLSIVTK